MAPASSSLHTVAATACASSEGWSTEDKNSPSRALMSPLLYPRTLSHSASAAVTATIPVDGVVRTCQSTLVRAKVSVWQVR